MKERTRNTLAGAAAGFIAGTAIMPIRVAYACMPILWPTLNAAQAASATHQLTSDTSWTVVAAAGGFAFGTGMMLASPVVSPTLILTSPLYPVAGTIIGGLAGRRK